MKRIILHLDMDAFFAAVEERDHPRLKSLPIVVGADPKGGVGRGVVSTANYAARKYGIKSAMPISTAWRLSEEAAKRGEPRAVFMEVDMKKYARVSHDVMAYLATKADVLEPASVDEAYIELKPDTEDREPKIWEGAEALAKEIKAHIKKIHGLTCTIGIGPNKLVAKIAAQEKKPDGLTTIRPDDVQKFLDPKPASVLPGIGPKTAAILSQMDIMTVSDLRRRSETELKDAFGKWGTEMYRKARGEDDSPVTAEYETKSVGEQETFEKDSLDPNFLIVRLKTLAEGAYRRFRREFSFFKTIGITVRFSDFETKTRAHTLPSPANDLAIIEYEALHLFLPFLDRRENPRKKKIRLLGVRIEKLSGEDGTRAAPTSPRPPKFRAQ